jgi:Chalcone isomerase-like
MNPLKCLAARRTPSPDRIDPERRRAAAALLLAVLPLPTLARAAPPPELGSVMPDASLKGQGRLRYLGLLIYDIRLWAVPPFDRTDPLAAPLALELVYARSLQGRAIAERSLAEMRGITTLDDTQAQRWLAQMSRIFPDVRSGDRITGVHRPGGPTAFFINGTLAGEVGDAAFGDTFFGIWLSPRSSQPRLRDALLGGRETA